MSYETYAIGTPGQPPRMFITAFDEDAAAQVQTGEVYFPADPYSPAAPHAISQDGTTLVASAVPLAQAQAELKRLAKVQRYDVRTGGCQTPLGPMDTDDASRQMLTEAATRAMSDPGYCVTWTMADDTDVEHDATALIAAQAAVTAHLNACHARWRELRASILAATTSDELNALDIAAGWPS